MNCFQKITKPAITANVLTKQVDEIVDSLNDIKKMLGKDSELTKTKLKRELKKVVAFHYPIRIEIES